MPIQINSTTINNKVDQVPYTYYQCNAGDEMVASFDMNSTIHVQTGVQSSIEINPVTFEMTWLNGSWLDEGFRVGDNISITLYNNLGSVIVSFNTYIILYVDDDVLQTQQSPIGYDQSQGESLVIENITRGRDGMTFFLNHTLNGATGGDFSLIDGEVTRAVFTGIDSMVVGAVLSGVIIGNQSGQFLKDCFLIRNPDVPGNITARAYTLVTEFLQSGIYDQTDFDTNDCLKLYVKMNWQSIANEPFSPTELLYNVDADTGWFDEPFNSGSINSSLISGVNQIDYATPTTFTVVVDGPTTDLGIGAAYVSIDDNYFKNQLESQDNLCMSIGTTLLQQTVYSSPTNPVAAGYSISVTNIVSIGSQTSIDITFTPNSFFQSFMDPRVDDRLFYLWIRCGDSNLLVHAQQLVKVFDTRVPLPMISSYAFLDHSQNVTEIIGFKDDYILDTEDNVAYYGTFLLKLEDVYQTLNFQLFAENTVLGASFNLTSVTIDLSGVLISNDGKYLFNESVPVTVNLPATSVKRNALVQLEPSLDIGTDYGVSVYFPWISQWQQWIPKPNANVDFNPTQNQNWEQYDNLLNWQIKFELGLATSDVLYFHQRNLEIRDYDADANVTTEINLYSDINQLVDIVFEGMLMTIVATHTLTTGTWDQANTWGEITIEPKEAAPRRLVSSVVDFDNDFTNPIYPLSTLLVPVTYPSPDVARMECFFDTSLINTTNGVSITAKIKDVTEGPGEGDKTMAPDDAPKVDTSDAQKNLAP